MTYGVKININKVNKNNVIFHIYRTLSSNINQNGAIIDNTQVQEVATINQDAYDTVYSENKENNQYVYYDIDENLHDDWITGNDARLCLDAVQYKSFLELTTGIPSVTYSAIKLGMISLQADVDSTTYNNFVYFVLGYVNNKLIADSRKYSNSKYIGCSVPAEIDLSNLKTEVYLDDGTGSYDLIETSDNINAKIPLKNFTSEFSKIIDANINTANCDVKIETDTNDNNCTLITVPNLIYNSTAANKYSQIEYIDSNFKVVVKMNGTPINTKNIPLDRYTSIANIKIITIEAVDDGNHKYIVNLFAKSLVGFNSSEYNKLSQYLCSSSAEDNFKFVANSSTSLYIGNVLYSDGGMYGQSETITVSLPVQLNDINKISISFIDENMDTIYKYEASSPYSFAYATRSDFTPNDTLTLY